MESRWVRAYLCELIGTFGVVLIGAGVVCLNQLTTPAGQQPGTSPLSLHQPGLLGVALAYGLIVAAMLAVTVPHSGGYLNPAITIMLWCFNRLDTARAAWYVGAQMIGGVLAAVVLRFIFAPEVWRAAQFGAPHINPLAYPALNYTTVLAGTGVELVLTFLVVFAIFGIVKEGFDARLAATAGGCAVVASVLFGYALTGAALNPARWFGPVFFESLSVEAATKSPWADALAYVAGPILGALLAGLVCFRVIGDSKDKKRVD